MRKWISTLILLALTAFTISYNFDYVQAYWIKYKLRNEHIVVSLTTTPYRVDRLNDVVETFIKSQILLPEKIYVNIPYVFLRDNINYEIPAKLATNPAIKILRTHDYGPGTKLLGTLEAADLPANTIIITIDDDILYPPLFIAKLAQRAHDFPNQAVGLRGSDLAFDANGEFTVPNHDGHGFKWKTKDKSIVKVLDGVGGIAYRRWFFDESIFKVKNSIPECINSDDVYLSFYLEQHNITKQVLNVKSANRDLLRNLPSPTDIANALSKRYNTTERHKTCVSHLSKLDSKINFYASQ